MGIRRIHVSGLRWAAGLVQLWFMLSPGLSAGQPVHHDLTVVLDPEAGELAVEDTVRLPPALAPSEPAYHFTLHKDWVPTTMDRGVAISRRPDLPSTVGSAYAVSVPPGQRTLTLSYHGRLGASGGSAGADEHGDALTPNAVMLSHGSGWYPMFGDELVTFTLAVRAPRGWEVVSQGRRAVHQRAENGLDVRWEAPEPQDEIYLVGGLLTEYTRDLGEITAMAFLRTPDPELADRYLDATGRYLDLYSALLGPYPYTKFAMVENAWETGYGMPSFTLLGSTVIRLPFILHSSYPHEILHNWWGNGVFVDARRGNWAEGLTAYLADHLMAEQRGTGAEYRRGALQQYADYVDADRDFPLAEFTARHSPATQAVGYGKALMVYHMVRRDLGDTVFLEALKGFFGRFKFRRATFTDLDRAFASAANRSAGPLAQWLDRAGAPSLTLSNAKAAPQGSQYLLTALVEQTQAGGPYRLRVPVAVTLDGRENAYQTSFLLDRKRLGLELIVPGRPLRLDVDPEFDLFRRLDRRELPPALSQLFGATRVQLIVPAAAPPELQEGYRRLAESLGRAAESYQIVADDAVDQLPRDRAIWILGWENRFRGAMVEAVVGLPVTIRDQAVSISGAELTRQGHAVALAGQRAGVGEYGLGWVACDRVEALAGLARKLPHYGQYGYLGFEGREPTNVAKGQWPVIHSPLSVPVKQVDGGIPDVPQGTLAARRSLTEAGDASGGR